MSTGPQVSSSTATQNSTERIGRLICCPCMTPEHHLEELALMTVSAEWLTRWQPISMHRAILAGAIPDQVAAAAGLSVREVFEQSECWAEGQRRSIIAGRPGVTVEEYATVRTRFAPPVAVDLALPTSPGGPGRPTTVKPRLTLRTEWGLLLPKPSHQVCRLCLCAPDVQRIVHQRLLASVAGDGRSYSLRYSALS
jgi:hypothetical protein